ncbi:MAG TPA: class I SAM-dependent methyltransferase, partial [bacterium]|nr:class I SAM-dependent methyltransferase [bacterium]
DCIVLNDVLEHMADPYSFLKHLRKKLSAAGVITASIPNVHHISVMKEYIFNRDWRYTESGTLDKTHLRFFSKKSIIRMFEEAGYGIRKIKGINASTSLKAKLFPVISFGFFSGTQYLQYGVAAELNKKK